MEAPSVERRPDVAFDRGPFSGRARLFPVTLAHLPRVDERNTADAGVRDPFHSSTRSSRPRPGPALRTPVKEPWTRSPLGQPTTQRKTLRRDEVKGRTGPQRMTSSVSPVTVDPPSRARSATSLRVLGVVVLVLFLLTSIVGGSLAVESSYLPVTLLSHIALALVTLGFAGYASSSVGRQYRRAPRAFASLAAFAALAATIAGAVFLFGGQSDASLYAMEGLAGLGILSSGGMIALGGASGKRAGAPVAPTVPNSAS